MDRRNYITIDGNGNIVLQDISGQVININSVEAIKYVFQNSTPEYLKQLHEQIEIHSNDLININKQQTNLIIDILNKHINNIYKQKDKSQKRVLQFAYFILILGVVIVAILFFFKLKKNTIKSHNSSNKIYPQKSIFGKKTETFNILILPFKNLDNKSNKDYGKIIQERLNVLNTKDTLNTNIYYYDNYSFCVNFNQDSASKLMIREKADMIIYGSYYAIDNGLKSENDISVQYVCKNSNYTNTDFSPQKASFSEFAKGKLQGNIEYVIYSLAAISLVKYAMSIKWIKLLYVNDKNNSVEYFGNLSKNEVHIYKKKVCLKAEKYLNRIINVLNIRNYNTYYYLSCAYFGMYDYEKAEFLLKKSLNTNNNFSLAYYGLAYIEECKHNYKVAIKYYNKTIDCDSTNSLSYFRLGNIFIKLKQNEKALYYFNLCIRFDSQNAKAYSNRGYLSMNHGLIIPAFNDFNKAILLDSTMVNTYINRGIIKNMMNDNLGAITDFNNAIKLAPDSAEFYLMRGVIYGLKLNNKVKAMSDYNFALKLTNDEKLKQTIYTEINKMN